MTAHINPSHVTCLYQAVLTVLFCQWELVGVAFPRKKMESCPQVGRANITARDSVERTLCCHLHSLITATRSGQKGAQFPSVMLASLVFCLCLQDFIHLSAIHPCSLP